MSISRRFIGPVLLGLGVACACPFDDTLREYLDAHFWLPFSKHSWHFEKRNVRRISAPFAGMAEARGDSPLEKLRAAYQDIPPPDPFRPPRAPFSVAPSREALAAVRADRSLTSLEREEVDLIDAKIDMRAGTPEDPELLRSAQKKLEAFLRSSRSPAFLSEARGWLAHIHYLLGEQTAAGKIYLDELNRNGSNLSRETLLTSLSMTYGYDGGAELRAHLDEYFDTPEHAAFAVQMITNPRWQRDVPRAEERADTSQQMYSQIKNLLERNRDLFKSDTGALTLLTMRTALRMGDPAAALTIARMIPAGAPVRAEPDYLWMLASSDFLSRDYKAAEQPLLSLFQSLRASPSQKSAAAYGLCGVYQKLGNAVEQIRFALWLKTADRKDMPYSGIPQIGDQSVYWATSGWDLSLLLESEAPDDALESFLNKYADAPGVRLVKYSLAVKRARENRYEEAAGIYESIHAGRRAPRMRQLAELYARANQPGVPREQAQESKYRLAEFISSNPNGIYFNDALWGGLQRYALTAANDSRLTREERDTLLAGERRLKDEQEERWRAYLILRDVVQDAGKTDLGRKSARLGLRCLRGINTDRFGRKNEIVKADLELSGWLRQ